MLLVILHLPTILNTHFTQISDVHSKFLPYLLSMIQITSLFVHYGTAPVNPCHPQNRG